MAQISFAVTAKLISAFVFATRIVQFLFYLNPKFQASSSFLSLYRPVCVGPGRKPRRPVFSRRGSYHDIAKRSVNVLGAMLLTDHMGYRVIITKPIVFVEHHVIAVAHVDRLYTS